MNQYSNENRGVLFRNMKKQSDNHPDHTGTLNVDGVEFWLSAWVKESKNGNKFFSLSIKKKEPVGDLREASGTAPPKQEQGEPLDEIPF